MHLAKAAKKSPHAKFYSLNTGHNYSRLHSSGVIAGTSPAQRDRGGKVLTVIYCNILRVK